MQKTKRAFHQLKKIHQAQKAFSFQSLSHSIPKQKRKLSQVLKVRIKSYWGAAQDISTRRLKAKNHDETNDLSY